MVSFCNQSFCCLLFDFITKKHSMFFIHLLVCLLRIMHFEKLFFFSSFFFNFFSISFCFLWKKTLFVKIYNHFFIFFSLFFVVVFLVNVIYDHEKLKINKRNEFLLLFCFPFCSISQSRSIRMCVCSNVWYLNL